jgi:hypothetical protein
MASRLLSARFAMRRASIAAMMLLSVLCGASVADPITGGTWSLAPSANNDGVGFYDGLSWDCAECNVGFQLLGPLEYLHDGAHRPVGFGYRQFAGALLISRTTDWTNGFLSWDPGTQGFMYDTGTGFFYNSWQGTNMVLFRMIGAAATTYFLGVEDIPIGWGREDRDFNDSIYRWSVLATVPPPPPVPPPPIPEPGTWALMLGGLAMLLRGRKSGGRTWTSAAIERRPDRRW